MKKIKDPVSGFTHLLGAVLSIAGLVLLMIWGAKFSDEVAWDIVSFAIFGSSLVLLYTFSAIYHLCNVGETATNILRKFDHIMIFILIAGTYTPICLGPLRGPWGWTQDKKPSCFVVEVEFLWNRYKRYFSRFLIFCRPILRRAPGIPERSGGRRRCWPWGCCWTCCVRWRR